LPLSAGAGALREKERRVRAILTPCAGALRVLAVLGAFTATSFSAAAGELPDQVSRPAAGAMGAAPGDDIGETPRPPSDFTPTARSNICPSGLVWRTAGPSDLVCVPPHARDRVAQENADGPNHVDPNGSYGPNTCVSGYVWRDAFPGDQVCVTVDSRRLASWENTSDRAQRR
jgi:hypothetical protein